MRIKVLGCSGGVGPGLLTTCLCIEDRFLIDAGTGVGSLDLAQMSALTDVFLTHSHLDHTCGLAFLADNRLARGAQTLRVHAQAETVQALRSHMFNWVLWADFEQLPDTRHPVLEFQPMALGTSAEVAGVSVTPFPSQHTVPAVGYALATESGCLAFTGDTYAGPQMWQALNALPRLDMLMIEVAFPDELADVGLASQHLTPARLGEQLRVLRHRPELLLSHPKPGSEQAIVEQCRVALRDWRYRHLRSGDSLEL
jgi:ribonuclease BN (tRNA processing enzyme)